MTIGAVSQRQDAVLVRVLYAMIGLTAASAVVQLVARSPAGWLVLDGTVGAALAALVGVARSGRERLAASVLVALFGVLPVTLVVAKGPEHPMWALLSAFTIALAAILIGGRAVLAVLAVAALVVVPVILLQDAGTLDPLMPDAAKKTPAGVTAVETVILLGVLAVIFRVAAPGARAVAPAPDAVIEPEPARGRTRTLTPREREVVQLIAEGQSNDAIAARLVISPRTVHTHVTNAMRKCGCGNRTELGVLAVREGLVPLTPPPTPAPAPATARTPSAPTGSHGSPASG